MCVHVFIYMWQRKTAMLNINTVFILCMCFEVNSLFSWPFQLQLVIFQVSVWKTDFINYVFAGEHNKMWHGIQRPFSKTKTQNNHSYIRVSKQNKIGLWFFSTSWKRSIIIKIIHDYLSKQYWAVLSRKQQEESSNTSARRSYGQPRTTELVDFILSSDQTTVISLVILSLLGWLAVPKFSETCWKQGENPRHFDAVRPPIPVWTEFSFKRME